MWLINTTTQELESFTDERQVSYAILSHRWGQKEMRFNQMKSGVANRKCDYQKVLNFCAQAREDGLTYAWIDTCCIDQSSSAELSEAINSMFRWYSTAKVCYVYLADVKRRDSRDGFRRDEWRKDFMASEWFTRGWTLQELLAPQNLTFYDSDWRFLSSKGGVLQEIRETTRISLKALRNETMTSFSVAEKFSWAAGRKTQRLEDQAYSLMGLFGVNMPMLYGEGERAFMRLQEEIIKVVNDYSIFAWHLPDPSTGGMLAKSPEGFAIATHLGVDETYFSTADRYNLTNAGLSIDLNLTPWKGPVELALLPVNARPPYGHLDRVGIFVERISLVGEYLRCEHHGKSFVIADPAKPDRFGFSKNYHLTRLLVPQNEHQVLARKNDRFREERDEQSTQFRFPSNEMLEVEQNLRKIDQMGMVSVQPRTGTITIVSDGDPVVTTIPINIQGFKQYVTIGFDHAANPIFMIHFTPRLGWTAETRTSDMDSIYDSEASIHRSPKLEFCPLGYQTDCYNVKPLSSRQLEIFYKTQSDQLFTDSEYQEMKVRKAVDGGLDGFAAVRINKRSLQEVCTLMTDPPSRLHVRRDYFEGRLYWNVEVDISAKGMRERAERPRSRRSRSDQ